MKQFKRLLYYLVINVFVSACTIFAVLTFWEQTHPAGVGIFASGTAATPTPLFSPNPVTPSEPTLEPTPTPRPLTTYNVKPGDTLGEIALEFDVSVDELMELNGMDDPSVLGSGQVLYVPLLPTQPPTQDPSIASEPTSTAPGPGSIPFGQVVISNVFGAGDLESERVHLVRSGEGVLSLAGWQLRDQDGNVYTFPQLVLSRSGEVDLYTRAGVNVVTTLYWGLSLPTWSPGEKVELVDPFGVIQAAYEVP